MGIYKFGNNTYARRVRRRSNLGHISREKKVRLMGWEIQYISLEFIHAVLYKMMLKYNISQ